jgi:hypothetical protein
MGGHINFLNGDITVLYPLVTQGTIRALAVAARSARRFLPNVPTAQELGYRDVYMENWYGALVPAATPPMSWRSSKPDHGCGEDAGGVGEDLGQRRLRAAGRESLPRADREGRGLLGPEIKKLGIQGSRRRPPAR